MLANVLSPSLLANDLISLHSEFISSQPVRKKGSSKNASLRLTGTVVSGILCSLNDSLLDILLAATALAALSNVTWMAPALVIMQLEGAAGKILGRGVTVWASVAD